MINLVAMKKIVCSFICRRRSDSASKQVDGPFRRTVEGENHKCVLTEHKDCKQDMSGAD